MDDDYAAALADAIGNGTALVAWLRQAIFHPNALNLWTVSDNMPKRPVLSRVQIVEILLKSYF
ncbi:hypothetical protein [Dasania marina]|uniref:hypothetical protein n=1 Tax=Dasania marina TaxID=471499 RepID=UPI0030DA6A41|tara:strand:- start:19286 stop:19474 length:189 start_codon:yes stop_codon:yes gene_type:complete